MHWRSNPKNKTKSSFTPIQTGLLQRKCTSNQSEPSVAPPIVHEVLSSPGQSLEQNTRTLMESRFNHDFSRVKIHTDEKAAKSSQALNAIAYTVQQDIAFDTGKYAPQSRTGRQLLAHELAHVVQQSRGGANPPNTQSEQAAQQASSNFDRANIPINPSGATAPGLACQKAPETTKSQPTVTPIITQQSGRTIVAINGVAIAEGTATPNEIDSAFKWTPENLDIVIIIPEGQEMILIEGSHTNATLLKLSSRFTLRLERKLKVPQKTLNEIEGKFSPLKEFETVQSITGQRPKPAPPQKAPVPPPQTPSKVTPPQENATPETSTTTVPESNVQVVAPPPINLNLPPSAKYGKPRTDEEIVKERVNKIITDAMAGRPDFPPLPKNMDQKTLLNIITQGVSEAVKPLIKGLPPNVQSFILDKIDSAVEEGVSAIVDAAVDSAKVDPTTKAAIKKAVEAGIKLKQPQPPPAKK